LWAHFRFAIVGPLLSAPVAHGGLQQALQELADTTWTHPVNGGPVQFSTSTIERWYYTARRSKYDPVRVLRRIIRKDAGQISLPAVQVAQLLTQYRNHEHWSYQLHYDNLVAWVQAQPTRGPLRSYSTVRRYMQARGWLRKRRRAAKGRPGEEVAAQRRERREIRSYEAEFLNEVTQAWVEMEDNRAVHRELGCSPVERFAKTRDVLRPSPSSEALRDAFRLQARRRQRQSDGTITLDGVRFEIPARYRHFRDVSVRYARWDLRRVDLVDPRQGTILAPLYPLDRHANADGQRWLFPLDASGVPAGDGQGVAPSPGDQEQPAAELPPLLKRNQLDEKCYLEVFQPAGPRPASKKKARV
jgi:hypothetical protein